MPEFTVDAEALGEVLTALNGKDYLIRELQVTRGPLFNNPIDKLTEQYNEQAAKHNQALKEPASIDSAYSQKDYEKLINPFGGLNQPFSAVEQLAELLRGLQVDPIGGTWPPQVLYKLGQTIATQAKAANPALKPPEGT